MNLIGEMSYGSARSRALICDDLLVVEYFGPLTVRGWIEAAMYAATVGEPYRFRGLLARMDRAVFMVAPKEIAEVVVERSAIVRRRVPGAIVVTSDHLSSMHALCERMGELGHLRRAFSDPLAAFVWARQEARAAPTRKRAPAGLRPAECPPVPA